MGRNKLQERSSAVVAAAVTETESGMGKEKEKEKKEKGRKKRMEMEKEQGGAKPKEGDAMGVGKRFFKVFFPAQSGERLKIPPQFDQYLDCEPPRMVSLKSPSGNTWQLKLDSDPEGLCFTEGWQEFVRDHSLKHGHFLVFTYDSRSQFSVVVFCPLGVEDPAALVAHPCRDMVIKDPCRDIVVKVEDGERGVDMVDADGTSEVLTVLEGQTQTRILPESSPLPAEVCVTELDKDSSLLCPNSSGSTVPSEEGDGTTRKRVRDQGGIDIVDAAGTSEVLTVPSEEGNGTTRRRVREMNDLMRDGPAAKKHSSVLKKAEKKKPEVIVTSYKAALAVLDTDKDASNSLLDEYSSCNKTRMRSKDVPRLGEYLLTTSRQPVVISQRRPVTEEEKIHTLKRAQEFKSKNPFTMRIMKESYVYVGFFMNLPCDFVRKSLPRRNKKMTLWDPQGKPWEVNYVYYAERCTAAFSGGWSRFSLGNNLEKSDICIYELFKEDNIKVHIYRVVQEITPLLRSSSK